jgi:ribosomal protein S12 methylthiotransferase
VDAIVGLNEVPRMAEIVREILGQRGNGEGVAITNRSHDTDAAHVPRLFWSGPAKYVPDYAAPRFRLTPRHYAYVKIAEGCNHPCSFCSIPRIRGKHRSRAVDDVLAEVRALVADGVREINLISQDTTFYGKDLHPSSVILSAAKDLPSGGKGEILRFAQNDKLNSNAPLCQLLREIQALEGDFWVRLLYTHPAHWSEELIATIAACDKVCRYVDMPLQHINDAMLTQMRRETSGQFIRDLVAKIRQGIPATAHRPAIALRTTFIVGFPGETEAQFEELMEFIEAAEFERLGIFTYSREDHTAAGAMEGQLTLKAKRRRYERAMELQQKISRRVQRRFIGQTLRVLVEEPLAQLPTEVVADFKRQRGCTKLPTTASGAWWLARSHADAPDIDGSVYVRGTATKGEFAEVRITDAAEYDLIGETTSLNR